MSYLLDHYRAACDPFHLGHTRVEQLGLLYPLTHGMVYPFPDGGVVLLRRRLYPTTGPWSYCGFARPDETSITQMAGFTHAADEAFQYTAARILGNGFISRFAEPVRFDFDDLGDHITPALPMFPRDRVATPLAGGTYRVVWRYCPFGQGGYPTDFQVFEGADAASVDYDTPLTDSVTGLDVVAYVGGATRFAFTTPAYGDGTDHVFGVRGRNSGGVAERNTYTSEPKRAKSVAPSAAAPTAMNMRRTP